MSQKREQFSYGIFVGDLLWFGGPNWFPPHPWRQCQSSLLLETNIEKNNILMILYDLKGFFKRIYTIVCMREAVYMSDL